MNYLLVGNYGVGNVGDEALREYFLERFPEVQWQVLSAYPQGSELPRFPAGLRSFFRFQWLRTVLALRWADGLVYGGGSLFTDSESLHACVIWAFPALFARLFRKPILLAFQGIGPFRTRMGEHLARWVIARASFISVRDAASAQRVEMWKKNTKIIQSFDPTISLLSKEKHDIRIKNLLIFIPRFSTAQSHAPHALCLSAQRIAHVLALLRRWQKERGPVRIISLHPGAPREHALSESVASSLGVPLEGVSSLSALGPLIRGATCVLTERYHGALSALAQGIPFFALRLSAGDKLDALSRQFRCPAATADSLSSSLLLETDWGRNARVLPALWEQAGALARRGEEALRRRIT